MKLFSQLKLKKIFITMFVLISLFSMSVTVHAERFFKQHSTWYEPIPDNPKILENSSKYINYYCNGVYSDRNITDGKTGWCAWTFANGEWDNPIWIDDGTATPQTVTRRYYRADFANQWDRAVENGWDVDIPFPANAASAGMSSLCDGKVRDGLMTIIDSTKTYAWEFYGALNCGDGWKAHLVVKWDLRSDGIYKPSAPSTALQGSVHGLASPLAHGMITYKEAVIDKHIDHAMNFSAGVSKWGPHVYPGSNKAIGGTSDDEWALPYGSRIQLLPDINCKTDYPTFNATEIAICVALQEYGAIFVDTTGGDHQVWLEDLNNKPESWFETESTIIHINKALNWTDFRVIEPLVPAFDNSSVTYQCSDGIDNDSDGLTDYPDDPGCSSATANSETDDSPSSDNYSYIINVDPLGTYIDAENFTGNIAQGGTAFSFLDDALLDFAGSGYLKTSGEVDWSCSEVDRGKEYKLNITDTGLYNIWIRGYGFSDSTDSIFVGVDGNCVGALNPNFIYDTWVWSNTIQKDTGVNTIYIATPGIHTFNIWIREPNFLIDGIYLTQGSEAPSNDVALLDSTPPASPSGLIVE